MVRVLLLRGMLTSIGSGVENLIFLVSHLTTLCSFRIYTFLWIATVLRATGLAPKPTRGMFVRSTQRTAAAWICNIFGSLVTCPRHHIGAEVNAWCSIKFRKASAKTRAIRNTLHPVMYTMIPFGVHFLSLAFANCCCQYILTIPFGTTSLPTRYGKRKCTCIVLVLSNPQQRWCTN